MAHASSTSTDVAARGSRPSRHVPAARDLAATTDDESYHGSASELPPATSHGYAEWDFSGVPDPVMFQRFLDAADYWFGYSDARECFSVIAHNQANTANAANAAEAGDREVPPNPMMRTRTTSHVHLHLQHQKHHVHLHQQHQKHLRCHLHH
jgi:hypothetical protein